MTETQAIVLIKTFNKWYMGMEPLPPIIAAFLEKPEVKEWMNGQDTTNKNFDSMWSYAMKNIQVVGELVRLKAIKDNPESTPEELTQYKERKEAAWKAARQLLEDFKTAHSDIIKLFA